MTEKTLKERYQALLKLTDAELVKLITRCLIPIPEEGIVTVDFARLEDELLLFRYRALPVRHYLAGLLLPVILVNSKERAATEALALLRFLKKEVSEDAYFVLSALVHALHFGVLEKDDWIAFHIPMEKKSDQIRFQRWKIDRMLHADGEIVNPFVSLDDAPGEILTLIRELAESRSSDSATEEAMTRYFLKLYSGTVSRSFYDERIQIERIFALKEGMEYHFPILGHTRMLEKRSFEGGVEIEFLCKLGQWTFHARQS